MKKNFGIALVGILFACSIVCAQDAATGTEARVALNAPAIAYDALKRPAVSGKLRSTEIHGTPDAPVTSIRLVVTNSMPTPYTYITGWAMFYDNEGVRCGSGMFKVDTLDPGESAEVDTPGLRLVCTPATWRILATNLLSPTVDQTGQTGLIRNTAPPTGSASTVVDSSRTIPPLVLSIDGEDHPIQVGNPITIKTNNKSVKLVLKVVK